jgi:hypothetical protein
MALDVYFKRDIENILRGVEHPTRRLVECVAEQDPRYAAGYTDGQRDTLAAIALAFGLIKDES